MKESEQNIISLAEIRKRHNVRVTQQSLSEKEQIRILHQDVDKLINIVLEQEERLETLEDRCWKLLRLVREMQASSFSSLPVPSEK